MQYWKAIMWINFWIIYILATPPSPRLQITSYFSTAYIWIYSIYQIHNLIKNFQIHLKSNIRDFYTEIYKSLKLYWDK